MRVEPSADASIVKTLDGNSTCWSPAAERLHERAERANHQSWERGRPMSVARARDGYVLAVIAVITALRWLGSAAVELLQGALVPQG